MLADRVVALPRVLGAKESNRLERVRREIDRVLDNRWITLRLDSWGVGIEGVRLVAESLRAPHNNISWLNLYGNGLGDDGVVFLAEALCSPHNKVTVLGLWDNNITDKGAYILAQALENPYCQVTLLDLQDNPMSPASAEFLMRAIRRKSGLETVMLPRTIDSETALKLKRLMGVANSRRVKVITHMLAVKHLPRLSSRSSLKVLSRDLIRHIATVLGEDTV